MKKIVVFIFLLLSVTFAFGDGGGSTYYSQPEKATEYQVKTEGKETRDEISESELRVTKKILLLGLFLLFTQGLSCVIIIKKCKLSASLEKP